MRVVGISKIHYVSCDHGSGLLSSLDVITPAFDAEFHGFLVQRLELSGKKVAGHLLTCQDCPEIRRRDHMYTHILYPSPV